MEANVNSLQMAVIPQQFLEELKTELSEVKAFLSSKEQQNFTSQWLESSKARKMLGVCQKTWQTYRDNRVIPFSQFGRKIFVKRADLEAFMESNYIQANH